MLGSLKVFILILILLNILKELSKIISKMSFLLTIKEAYSKFTFFFN